MISWLNRTIWTSNQFEYWYRNYLICCIDSDFYSHFHCLFTKTQECAAKFQNTPQLWSASLTCVGRLWRSRHNTIDAILIQWHVNELRGILKLLLFLKRLFGQIKITRMERQKENIWNYMISWNRPFYSCVLSCLAFVLERGWRWLCFVRDQYLVSMVSKYFTFEKQQGLYHNRINYSLNPIQRLGQPL